MAKVLFLLKKNLKYGDQFTQISKSGLLNSVRFLSESLKQNLGIETITEICVDGNEVNKFIHIHRPQYCMIDAIWVTPTKMAELSKLWPDVEFIIRVHSKIPFLSLEGVAVSWLKEYAAIGNNVSIGFNNKDTANDFEAIGIRCIYLPNIYEIKIEHMNWLKEFTGKWSFYKHEKQVLKVGCFGAIRPLKNQLLQAVAAMKYCEANGHTLQFYINDGRVEHGDNILKNIRALFENTRHKLMEVGWLSHDDFKKLIGDMDVCMQMSFSESFNIVTADTVDIGVPIVASRDIDWLPNECIADDTDAEDIATKIGHVLRHKQRIIYEARKHLNMYNRRSIMYYYFLTNIPNQWQR